jgi:multidrug efflux system outer membrane protein
MNVPVVRFRVVALAFWILFCFAGCTVGPDYHRPAPLGTNSIPATFSMPATNAAPADTNAPDWKPAQPAAHLPRGAWWEFFQDPELSRLEPLATARNQEIAGAVARFDEARASVNVERAGLFPQIELDTSYTRQRSSANEPSSGHALGFSPTFNTFTASLQAGWEVDLWGRVRRSVESARARLSASAADLESLKLSLQAEVAADYITLRATDSEYDLLVRSAEAYRRSLDLTTTRRKGGIATDLDVAQAETQLRNTEAQLPPLELNRAKLVHALATLCGEPATTFALPVNPAEFAPTPIVPLIVPSELLERRPDIAVAEQRMTSANAQIGVAQTAFYPSLRLNGLAGFESVDASTWFDWPSHLWAFGPSVRLPLFTGGLHRAQLAFARASWDETVAAYRQTVLAAFQEVEDRLAAQRLLKAELEATAAALVAARRTLEIANGRYRAGLVTYLEVAVAQASALNIERNLVQLRASKLVSTVGLIKALGGGWQSRAPEARAEAH